jgi:diacylglycerol kinase family enzyme
VPRAVLIVNPFASRVTEARLADVVSALGVEDVVRTEWPGHATELVQAAGDVERIYVFSGDGGFNEALNGSDGRIPLGFVPGGGTSVLPRALGLPRDPVRAAERLAGASPRRISLGRVNGRRFGFSAGVGLDAEVVRRVELLGRTETGQRAGDLRFAWTIVRAIAERRARFDPVLEVEGLGRAAFALVANASPYTYAGPVPLRLVPDARFELGLDLVAPRALRARQLAAVVRYLATGRGHLDLVRVHDADRIVVRCDAPMPLQADGEDLGDVAEVVFEAERDAVTVLA